MFKIANMSLVDDDLSRIAERREPLDRRSRPTPPISRYWLIGRRRGGRRDSERTNIYVDRYTTGEWLLVVGVLLLSLADLLFTIRHVSAGGEEANPVMAWAMQWGDLGFAAIKMGITVAGLLILLLHARFRKVRALMNFAVVLYSALLGYHLYLNFVLPAA